MLQLIESKAIVDVKNQRFSDWQPIQYMEVIGSGPGPVLSPTKFVIATQQELL